MNAQPGPPGPFNRSAMGRRLRENIESLAQRRREELAAEPLSSRLSDRITAFAGSMLFVFIHAVIYGAWILANIGLVPGLKPFDPSLVILAMAASVEAIFLSTFVLISQNRMMAAADRRADLDLHISLLAEHELTHVAAIVERIADKLGVPVNDPDFAEVKSDVDPNAVIDALDQASPDREAPVLK